MVGEIAQILYAIVGDKPFTSKELKYLVPIDVNALVDQCAIQPYLYGCVGKFWVKARHRQRKAKARLEIIQSKVKDTIRKSPDSHGVEKITDKSVEAAMICDESVKAANNDYIQACYESDAANILLTIFEQKSSMLKGEVTLFNTQYVHETGRMGKMDIRTAENEVIKIRSEKEDD